MSESEDPIEAGWQRLQSSWDDDDAHRRFLSLCASFDRLADAGKRYREVQEGHPDEARRRTAEAQIDRLLGLAMARLESTKTPPAPNRQRNLRLLAMAVAVAMVLAAGLLLRSS